MNKSKKIMILLLFTFIVCVALAGCTLQDKIEEYSSDKEQCYLNTENVTRFSYKGNDHTILADTVSNGGLGEWIGYIRQLAAIDENGKILLQENVETVTFQSLADLAEKAPEAAYIIPFLNVYAAPNADDYLIVDVNGGYHKAVISENVKDSDTIFDFKKTKESINDSFEVNPENATQLLWGGTVYQVTSDMVSDEGGGFTPEALHHAQEQFFMGDKSRTSNMHFGMGLYITSNIIKQHGGQLVLSNSKKTGGAQVIIKIPY